MTFVPGDEVVLLSIGGDSGGLYSIVIGKRTDEKIGTIIFSSCTGYPGGASDSGVLGWRRWDD